MNARPTPGIDTRIDATTLADDPDAAWRRIHAAACAPYRAAGHFAWHFARGKLARDPVFRVALERGWLGRAAHILDLGCGQGLLASLLIAAQQAAHERRWPSSWSAAPDPRAIHGIELMAKDVARARAALGTRADIVAGDIRQSELPRADTVVLLDVLHYIDLDDQERLLTRIRRTLGAGGRLLCRVGDTAAGRRHRISQIADWLVTRSRGHPVAPRHTRSIDAWRESLARRGFIVETLPMSQGTPFANVLLLARLEA